MSTETIDDGGAAFPVVSDQFGHHGGMSLRDWFAGQAIIGAMAMASHPRMIPGQIDYAEFAKDCYRTADAMLAARKVSVNAG